MSVMDDEHHTSPEDELGGIPQPYSRDDIEYDLIVRQEPKQARMCGVGTKADRRPIDPPPVVQLRVIEKGSRSRRSSSPDDRAHYNQSFLQNPYYFMYASLANPDRDEELHLLKDGKTRCTTGSVVSSLYHLKDPEADSEGRTGRDAGFFVFPDLSVRTEGTYRLKLTLFEVIGANVHHCKSIFSAPFYVYTAKKFPGMEESTNLSCALADQGIKIRIRKDVRIRKRTLDPNWFQPVQRDDGSDASDDEATTSARDPKRPRNEVAVAGPAPPPPPAPAAVPPPAPANAPGTWGAINPALPPGPAPPPPPPPAGSEASPYDARSSFNAGSAPAPTPTAAPSTGTAGAGATHPEYPPPQPHQHAPYMPPPPPPGGMYPGAYGWGPVPPHPAHPHAPPPQGYGGYPGYDHHRGQPYGAPMHYGAPPPYGYYDQYGHPPPTAQQPQQQPQQQASQPNTQNESPRSAGATGSQSAQQGRGKEAYPPPPSSTPGMVPGYAGQEYGGYGRPPPPPASAPAQGRPYHTSPQPGAPPQSAPATSSGAGTGTPGGVPAGAYGTPPQMGHYMPAHQHTPYGYGATSVDPYQQHQQQPHQAQQWGYPAPAPAPFGGYGRPGGWGVPPAPGDPYGGYTSQTSNTGAGATSSGNTAGSAGYVRPGPEENGRRSPPVPSISGTGRGYTSSSHGHHNTHGSPTRSSAGSNGNSGANGASAANGGVGGNSDRIQLAPLRGNGPPSAADQAVVAAAAAAYGVSGVGPVGGVGSVLGKKNPLSIGSIISDES